MFHRTSEDCCCLLLSHKCIRLTVPHSRELSDAAITMPRAIMWTVGPNAAFGFLMAVTLIFTLGDPEEILNTRTGQPFIQIFYNGVRSLGGTNVMVAIVVICLTSCAISEVATASRQLWSFARDNGLPFSPWLSHVGEPSSIMVSALLTAS